MLLAQVFPDLPSPTPWETPTPQATVDHFIDDGENLIATAQSDEYEFTADGSEVQFNDEDILPDIETSDSQLLFSYFKWSVSNGTESVLGPFLPLVIPIG